MTPTPDRVKRILEDLDSVQENLLALSDDIWLNIDHNDNQALMDGARFKHEYNERLEQFRKVSEEIRGLVESYTGVVSAEGPLAEGDGAGEGTLDPVTDNAERERRRRNIAALDGSEPHYLDEDMTFKRPQGFVLLDNVVSDARTWKRVLLGVCRQLHQMDASVFAALPQNPRFISNRGNASFSMDRGDLRNPMAVPGGMYVETNLSATHICNLLGRLLVEFGRDPRDMQVYLREDRDA